MKQDKEEKDNNIVSQRASRISPSGIRKFFDLLGSIEGVISLGVGEPDYTTPWHIREAAIYSIENGFTMYTSNSGIPELRQELSRYIQKRYELEYDWKTELLITVGVSEALDLAMRAVIDPGDEVIMSDPCYVAYEPSVILSGGVPVKVPTSEENAFELDARDIEAKITNKTKAILMGYPSNPTGAVMPWEKLVKIADVACRHNLLMIVDEIYSHLVYGIEHTCMAALPGMKECTVLLSGFSKSYAMTGWRIGYAAANKEIIAAMTKIHQYTIMCAPTMAQIAAIEALKSGEDSVTEMVEDYNHRRLVMVKGLRNIGLSCFEPKGAFYAFPSIKSTGMKSEEFAERLLIEEKVAVVPGTAFGKCGEGYIRCCYATSLKEIEEALERMKWFVERHRKA
ncbi:MAG: aminotransferase class I/II-fold pyridoxal phosphate-dependent enzyme [Dehalococcoidales bacterium]|nr:aminotransferase class I/II-fold pyridoxal phosphate-dependent enzyme [Dehalococcoidales bacterium]